jgi:dTDP-glucose 4,6-dehydratase
LTTLVVTGGAGFIGANYVRRRLATCPKDRVVVIDGLTYAGNPKNLEGIEIGPSYRFVHADIGDSAAVGPVFAEERPEYVVHLAAESHVDRSIQGPRVFTVSNVLGTQSLLDVARANGVKRFLMASTDEVYGTLGAGGLFSERSQISPNSPYSASKAAADLMALAFHRTFQMDVVVTRSCNNFGPYQHPEKLIPLMIMQAVRNEPLPVYGDGKQVRDWIHVDDCCRATDLVLENGRAGEVYNIGARNERPNLEIVHRILARLNKPASLIQHVADRPGHDRRYALDTTKLESELGFQATRVFETALDETIDWYAERAA